MSQQSGAGSSSASAGSGWVVEGRLKLHDDMFECLVGLVDGVIESCEAGNPQWATTAVTSFARAPLLIVRARPPTSPHPAASQRLRPRLRSSGLHA